MAVYVLVHGAWHGGWAWRNVVPLLRAVGHEVFTPTLTGLGERAHLAGPQVGLATNVEDVVSVLEFEDLAGVVLVGHSYGGMVITAAADQVPDRVAHLVYLDAFVPEDGQALVDLMGPAVRQEFEARVRTEGDGWQLPGRFPEPWQEALREHYGVTDAADLRWMVPRMRPQPYRTFTEPVRLASGAAARLPRTYIRCAQYVNPTFERFAAAARQPGSGWRCHDLPTSHDAMVTMPRQLADLLLAAA